MRRRFLLGQTDVTAGHQAHGDGVGHRIGGISTHPRRSGRVIRIDGPRQCSDRQRGADEFKTFAQQRFTARLRCLRGRF